MVKPITGKTHVGERREKRPNGDIYVYERITAYNEKIRKTYTVSQTLKGKIKSGTQKIVPTRSKKSRGERGGADATRRHTGLTDILEWVGKVSGIDDDVQGVSHFLHSTILTSIHTEPNFLHDQRHPPVN